MAKPIAVVRDIYKEMDVKDWNEEQRKTYRDKQLDGNPDVLFRVYRPVHLPDQNNLRGLLFRPTTDPEQWMTLIEDKYPNLTPQQTNRRATQPGRDVIHISGSSNKLQAFCTAFPGHLQEINHHFKENHDDVHENKSLRAILRDQEARIKRLEEIIQANKEGIQEASEQHLEPKLENLKLQQN